MTVQYKVGFPCEDGGNIHELTEVDDDERVAEWECTDCNLEVVEGEKPLGSYTVASIVE